MNTKLKIVYFIWANDEKNYSTIITGQLEDLKTSGVMCNANLYIVACSENSLTLLRVEELINTLLRGCSFELELHPNNFFEFHGINKLWNLAILDPTSFFLYMHAKGMSNFYNNISNRHSYEVFLTRKTLGACAEVIKLFDQNPSVMKAGLFPSKHHLPNDYVWLNFFYAKGEYLITCNQPIISVNRYYYELWSGTGKLGGDESVFNILEKNYRKYLLNEVGDILNAASI